MKCKIAHAQDSHIGLKRENNEDSFVCLEFPDIPELIALGAIDGVGGYTGGEVAATLCKYFVEKYLEKHQSELHKNPLEFISHALQKANNVIYKEREKQEHLSRMSCVATVALLNCKQQCLYFAHVGDTRGYIYREAELIKFTEDHSLVGYLEDLGEITEEEALAHPRRNEVSKALGGKVLKPGSKYIQSGEHSFYSNDIVLFCSDGLTDLVTRDEIRVILQSEATLDEKKKALIDTANTKGGKDNITVALASYPKKTKEVTNVIISKTKRQSCKMHNIKNN